MAAGEEASVFFKGVVQVCSTIFSFPSFLHSLSLFWDRVTVNRPCWLWCHDPCVSVSSDEISMPGMLHHAHCLEGTQKIAAEKKDEGKWKDVWVVPVALCHINQYFIEQSRVYGVSAAAKYLRLCRSTAFLSSVTYLSMSVLMWTRWLLFLWYFYHLLITVIGEYNWVNNT